MDPPRARGAADLPRWAPTWRCADEGEAGPLRLWPGGLDQADAWAGFLFRGASVRHWAISATALCFRVVPEFSSPKWHVPALLLACNLVCSQNPLVGASRSRISLDEAAVFAGTLWRVGAQDCRAGPGRQARPQEGVGAGEALALLFRQAESPCRQNS